MNDFGAPIAICGRKLHIPFLFSRLSQARYRMAEAASIDLIVFAGGRWSVYFSVVFHFLLPPVCTFCMYLTLTSVSYLSHAECWSGWIEAECRW
jgi:hypothetical protein